MINSTLLKGCYIHSFFTCVLHPSGLNFQSASSSAIVTILTLSSSCLPHCYPGFSCFHSLGENTHLASNYHSLVDSQIAILFYSTPFLKSCSEQSCFRTYCESPSLSCNHNFSCLQLSLHYFLIFVPFTLFFHPSYYLPYLFCFSLTHRCTHTYVSI